MPLGFLLSCFPSCKACRAAVSHVEAVGRGMQEGSRPRHAHRFMSDDPGSSRKQLAAHISNRFSHGAALSAVFREYELHEAASFAAPAQHRNGTLPRRWHPTAPCLLQAFLGHMVRAA